MKKKSIFKNTQQVPRIAILLIISLIINIYSLKAQVSNDHPSYILTNKGEKILIESGSPITFNTKKIEYYAYSNKKPLRNWKKIRISGKEIEKIIDKDRLYLPYQPYRKKPNIFNVYRVIAKTNDYTLGHVIYRKVSRDLHAVREGDFSKPDRIKRKDYFFVIDKNGKVISNGPLSNVSEEEIDKSVEKINKIFGDCLKRENLFDRVYVKFVGQINNTRMDTVPRFLHNVNQLDCSISGSD